MLKIRTRGYRSFQGEEEVAIRPLTLFFGRNQAGKSAMLRLLPLLGDSLTARAGALDLESRALCAATFKEICWRGPEPTSQLDLAFLVDPDQQYRLRLGPEAQGIAVREVELQSGRGQRWAAWPIGEKPGPDGRQLIYGADVESGRWEGALEFKGLFPYGLPTSLGQVVERIRTELAPLERVQWLEPRRRPAVRLRALSRPKDRCEPDGSDLLSLLQDRIELQRSVSAWLSEHFHEELEIVQDSDSTLVLNLRPHDSWERLPLHLAGEGLAAALPVVSVAAWADQRTESSPTLLAIEEPESQLHPDTQQLVIARLLETVRRGIPVVIETHSVHILMAVQLAVLEHQQQVDRGLRPEDVGIYWVERSPQGKSTLLPVQVNRDATLSGWPPGVLEQEQATARRILDMRWDQLEAEEAAGTDQDP